MLRPAEALRLDERGDEILAEVVVDDVAPVLVEESGALLGPLRRHYRVSRQPVGGGGSVDLPVQIPTRRFVARVVELSDERLHLVQYSVARDASSPAAGNSTSRSNASRSSLGNATSIP